MPKRDPNRFDPRPPQPPKGPPPGDPPPNQRKYRLQLVNLNLPILPELLKGSQVIFDGEPAACARTPLGTRVGDVSEADLERLTGVTILASTIYQVELEPALVMVEVLVG